MAAERPYTWNKAKRRENRTKHGVDFSAAEGFDWDNAIVRPDTRKDYGENRFIALGAIKGSLHVLVFTERDDSIRVISLRKASRKERLHYGTR
jgi:uncharacterized DUF497 family protein